METILLFIRCLKRGSTWTPPQDAAEGHYYYLSSHGEVVYLPWTQTRIELPNDLADTVDDTQLPRPSSPSRGVEGSPAILASPKIEALEKENTTFDIAPATTDQPSRFEKPQDSAVRSRSKDRNEGLPLGEPEPKPRGRSRRDAQNARSHQRGSSDDQPANDVIFKAIDTSKVDHGKLVTFEFSLHPTSRAPSYQSRRSSSRESCSTLPPYPGSPSCPPEEDIVKHAKIPPLELISETENEESQTAETEPTAQQAAEITFDFIDVPFFGSEHARPIPGVFTEQELYQIRRKNRHIFRVLTRTSLGLSSSLALAGVAPQLLIAAAINGYCLRQGFRELQDQLEFLDDNKLGIRKKDCGLNHIRVIP